MSWAIWVTGLPGSGKSALARATAELLHSRGEPVRVLELDEIRRVITPEPQYTDAERDLVYRGLGYMAAVLVGARIPVIIDATAHRREWRNLARAAIPRFAEVQVVCPLEVCRARERGRQDSHAPRGIYAHGGHPGATVPGVDVPYEPALAPELVVDSVTEPVGDAAQRVAALAGILAREVVTEVPAAVPSCAVWITGRPGSGKSTVAQRVLRALSARRVPAAVLDLAAARHRMLPDRSGTEREQEVVHRVLGYTAKLLTEAGVAVIVDATAPRRAWREAARQLIPRFAEVQLVCPAEVCAERERATRWRLGGDRADTPRAPTSPTPEFALEYEESLRPELVLRTDEHDPWTAAEQVVFLVQRLRRAVSVSFESS